MRTITVNGITPTTDIETKGQAIITLVKTYIPGLVGRYYGYQNIGRKDISFPAFFVEPMNVDFKMVTTGKYHLFIIYMLEWYIVDNNSSDAVTLCTYAADALKKLFSNNALGNLNNQFKAYDPYWIDSEMMSIEIGRSLRNPTPQSNDKYLRAGRMRFQVQDVFVA